MNEDRLKELFEYGDLKLIQGVRLGRTSFSDAGLRVLVGMGLENLMTLSLENNFITDLTILKGLDLKRLVDIDVSGNPLSLESA